MGNKPSTTTTTTKQDTTKNPWAPTIDPLTGIVKKADALAGDVSNFTPQYSEQTTRGIQGLTDLANSGQPGGYDFMNNIMGGAGQGFNAGVGQLENVASGGMIGANPHFNPVMQRTIDDTTRAVNSQFTAGGRYGSGAHAGALGREVGNVVGNMQMANYGTERAAQDNAARTLYGGGLQGGQYAGQLDALAKNPALTHLQAGGLQDQIINGQRQAPMNALNWQAGITNPIAQQGGTSNSNGTESKQTVQPVNKFGQVLGGGMMAAGLLAAPFTGGASLRLVGSGANMMSGQGGEASGFGSLAGIFGGGGGGMGMPGGGMGFAGANDPGGTYWG